jgi:ASPIC and UnbV/FG-GAP-like repeat
MDMFEGVGRRLDEKTGSLVEIGAHSLNGRERKVLFRNNGDGTFTDVAFVDGVARQEDGRGLTIFDYDGDGQLDLLLRNYKQPTELLKNTGGLNRWVEFKLVGTVSNRDAVGAKIRLRTSRGWQTRVVTAGSAYLSQQSLIQHFGLGADRTALEVLITWPSGATTHIGELDGRHRFTITENSLKPISCADPACAD